MTLCGYGLAFWQWKALNPLAGPLELRLENPFDLDTALKFGALLALIVLAARALREWLGYRGLYLLAAISGLADVDAITLSASRPVSRGLDESIGARAILIAAWPTAWSRRRSPSTSAGARSSGG
jgi:uncharacterized membrane protein (DUF4010 family)